MICPRSASVARSLECDGSRSRNWNSIQWTPEQREMSVREERKRENRSSFMHLFQLAYVVKTSDNRMYEHRPSPSNWDGRYCVMNKKCNDKLRLWWWRWWRWWRHGVIVVTGPTWTTNAHLRHAATVRCLSLNYHVLFSCEEDEFAGKWNCHRHLNANGVRFN